MYKRQVINPIIILNALSIGAKKLVTPSINSFTFSIIPGNAFTIIPASINPKNSNNLLNIFPPPPSSSEGLTLSFILSREVPTGDSSCLSSLPNFFLCS